MKKPKEIKIALVGLGYVGLPLAVEFSKHYNVIGFDINSKRIEELINFNDNTKEVSKGDLKYVMSKENNYRLFLTNKLNDIKSFNIYIITVPTPINRFKAPDLELLISATKQIGSILKKDDLIIYESTVYPGCTEEDCVPILEEFSNLKFNKDFFCGYSPERINPGDKKNTLVNIKKVTSGSTPETANFVNNLYQSIIQAGTFKASSIKVAEASKAIENAQRDINISFMNELALIFDKMGIDTYDVLDAASTKWNFLNFKPGLVGGHCIGVDPYYLAHKSESLGYSPQVILSGRRVNDNMGKFIVEKLNKAMIKKGVKLKGSKILLLGITFKENCPDIRNTKVVDVYNELIEYGFKVDVSDPLADKIETQRELGITLIDKISNYDAIILAVAHLNFLEIDLNKLKKDKSSIVFDLKNFFDRKFIDLRL
jgi:UDP-N-acetyl-D-galactosamine dehydrogenase